MRNDVSGIYKIFCTANDRYYYGASRDVGRRLRTHRSVLKNGQHKNQILQNTWNKHGESSFVMEMVEPVELSRLFAVEDIYLKDHVGKPKCMNIRSSGYSVYKKSTSQETRDKLSRAARGNTSALGHRLSDEVRAKLREVALRRTHSETTKKRIGNANTGHTRNNGTDHPLYGKYHTEETKRKMRESQQKRRMMEK